MRRMSIFETGISWCDVCGEDIEFNIKDNYVTCDNCGANYDVYVDSYSGGDTFPHIEKVKEKEK